MTRAAPSPVKRYVQLTGGVLLVISAPIVAPLPGPAGTLFFAGGMILILRDSHRARRRWARLKRRWPRTGAFMDRAMRRGSAIRRREREKSASQN